MISKRFFLLAAWAAVSVPLSAWAQLGGIEAEFAGAGARPLSMGGSFLALADDSTAAEFNPAGIRVLRRPELAWQVTRTYDRRDVFLPRTSIENREGIRGGDTNLWNTPSFISYVHPGQDFTWAISQLTTIELTNRFTDTDSRGRTFSFDNQVTNNAFGLTFATDLKPRLHVGVTLRMNRFDLRLDESRISHPLEITDWSPSFNVGVLWRATKDWSYGAVYKSRQKIEISDPRATDTELPQTIGFGVAYHPNDRLRVLADVDFISWSDFDSDPNDAFIRQDVTRFHLGAEYLFCLKDEEAWFVRAGYMREEANDIFYDPSLRGASVTDLENEIYVGGFPKPDDKDHLSFGIGVAKENYQLDLAVDQALHGETTLILSMIHYF